jgi:hypothetical protein
LYSPKQTQEEVIERLTEINNNTCDADKQEIDYLKQTFYKLHKSEQDTARKNFIEQGGNPEDFTPAPDPLEDKFKEIMSSIKEKRSVMAAEQEQEKEENLQKKLEILEKMKALTENTEDTGKIYNEFKQLQQKWNEIKQIPVGKINELWKTYQLYTEKFYDMVKLNNEFREYDFKKNLEQKTYLCEAAEKLAERGISAEVVHVPTVKPLDEQTLFASAQKCGAVLTAEEGQIAGGFGGAVAEFLSEHAPVPLRRIGVRDAFGESGTMTELWQKHGLDAETIVQQAQMMLQ